MLASNIFQKNGIWFLITFWCVGQLAAYFHFGVVTSVDTPHYVALADQLLNGNLPQGSDISYATYVLLITLFRFISFPIESVVIIQIIIAGFSVFALHQFTFILSNSSIAAFFATLLYCLWPKFYQWNLIIYTDSLFVSMIILSFYWLHKSKRWPEYSLAILLILATIFIRPPGLGLLFATTVWGAFKIVPMVKSEVYIASIGLFGFIAFLLVLNTVLGSFIESFIASYQAAEVIYPNIPWLIAQADSLVIPAKDHPPLIRLLEIYGYNPLYMTKLFFAKVVLLLSHAKPYYSSSHNLLIAVFLLPTYILAIIGISNCKKNPFIIVVLSFITFQILMVGLTSENWDGRFLLPILPIVFIFAGMGFENILEKLKFSKN